MQVISGPQEVTVKQLLREGWQGQNLKLNLPTSPAPPLLALLRVHASLQQLPSWPLGALGHLLAFISA